MRRKTLTAGENFTRKFLGFLNPNKGGSASDAIEPWSVFAICAFAAARDVRQRAVSVRALDELMEYSGAANRKSYIRRHR